MSGDGRWLATAGFPIPSLRLWDVRRRTIVSTSFLSPFTIAADVAFSPDGSRLAVAVNDGAGATAIQILSVPSLDRLSTVPAPEVRSVRFSPDGRLLVFGDEQGRVQLYDTRTSRPHGPPLVGHTGGVVTANFSPDGQTLVTTSDDGTTRLWDVSSGRPIGNALPGPAQHYVAAAFVDHGTHLVTLYDDGRGYLWDIRPQFWRASGLRGRWAHAHTRGVERCTARAHLCPRVFAALTLRCRSARHRGEGSLSGPGWNRTNDLGIKSLARTSAANCYDLKQPATSTNPCCTEMRDAAGTRDTPVLPAVLLFGESMLAQPRGVLLG